MLLFTVRKPRLLCDLVNAVDRAAFFNTNNTKFFCMADLLVLDIECFALVLVADFQIFHNGKIAHAGPAALCAQNVDDFNVPSPGSVLRRASS